MNLKSVLKTIVRVAPAVVAAVREVKRAAKPTTRHPRERGDPDEVPTPQS